MDTVSLKIKRQDDPGDIPYWEEFAIEYKKGMTVLTLLEAIRERPVTSDGNQTVPVAFESSCMEGECGACTMIINGRVGLSCRTFVDDLDSPIVLEPLSKFPVVRDLKTDRAKMFDALTETSPWVEGDSVYADPNALRMSPKDVSNLNRFAACIMCGACAEACPQVNERSQFAGAFLMGIVLPLNLHPVGKFDASLRLNAIMQRGGLADCAGARACDRVCPKSIPLSEAVSRLGLAAGVYSIKRLFWGG